MNLTWFALAAVFLAVSSVFFGRAGRAATRQEARNARFAGALLSVAGIAFLVSAILSIVTAD